jgi:hypothetical protein
VRLSANTGICVDLKGGEHEAEREHLHLWDLRGSECEAEREHWYLLRAGHKGTGAPIYAGHLNTFLLPPGPL